LLEESRGLFHQRFTSNFHTTNPKSAKRHQWLDCLFALLGSACVKTACKHVGDIDPNSTNLLFLHKHNIFNFSILFYINTFLSYVTQAKTPKHQKTKKNKVWKDWLMGLKLSSNSIFWLFWNDLKKSCLVWKIYEALKLEIGIFKTIFFSSFSFQVLSWGLKYAISFLVL